MNPKPISIIIQGFWSLTRNSSNDYNISICIFLIYFFSHSRHIIHKFCPIIFWCWQVDSIVTKMHFRCIKTNGKVYLGMQQIKKYNVAAFWIRKYRDFKFIQIFIFKILQITRYAGFLNFMWPSINKHFSGSNISICTCVKNNLNTISLLSYHFKRFCVSHHTLLRQEI